jgi:phosphate transport system substrate-binding protein
MKKNVRGAAILLFLLVFVIGAFSACSSEGGDKNSSQDTNNESNDTTDNTDNQEEALSGTITMAGSTSMEKLANVAAEAFMTKYPDVTVSAEFIGSSAGVEAVLAKTVDIGNASRNLKDSEISSGAVENIVAIDGIAVILDNANSVTNITKDQLVQIYTGEINNWSAVGGSDQPIVVVGRESGSGTRGAFEELLEVEDLCKYSNEINSTGGVMAKVASTPGAIGYVSLDVLDDTVIAANIDGVEATEENIKAGNYLLSRPFVMATIGEITAQNELVQAFFEYMMSDEGKELIKSVGLITVD